MTSQVLGRRRQIGVENRAFPARRSAIDSRTAKERSFVEADQAPKWPRLAVRWSRPLDEAARDLPLVSIPALSSSRTRSTTRASPTTRQDPRDNLRPIPEHLVRPGSPPSLPSPSDPSPQMRPFVPTSRLRGSHLSLPTASPTHDRRVEAESQGGKM